MSLVMSEVSLILFLTVYRGRRSAFASRSLKFFGRKGGGPVYLGFGQHCRGQSNSERRCNQIRSFDSVTYNGLFTNLGTV